MNLKVCVLFGDQRYNVPLDICIKRHLDEENREWALNFCVSVLEANNPELLKFTKNIYLDFLKRYHTLFQQILDEDTSLFKKSSLEEFQKIISLNQQLNSCVFRTFSVPYNNDDEILRANQFYDFVYYFLNDSDFLTDNIFKKLDELFISKVDGLYIGMFSEFYKNELPNVIRNICDKRVEVIQRRIQKDAATDYRNYRKELFTRNSRKGKVKTQIRYY